MRTVGLEIGKAAGNDGDNAPKAFEKLTKGELEAIAEAEGIDLTGASNNDERRALIVEARKAAGNDGDSA
ncbi:MAG: hypothetical protein FDZ75_05530 [Actinobacteria bacterium]|nr:MAG: hypothetical protein FDZ75_05530 [Actinomycetota bacterium]